jgi:hypothetical protein
MKHLKHTSETLAKTPETLKKPLQKHKQHPNKTLVTYIYVKHIQHPNRYICNIHLKNR